MDTDYIPDEKKTIASLRQNRLLKRVQGDSQRVLSTDLWWRQTYIELGGLVLIVALNLLLISPLVGSASTFNTFPGPIIPYLANFVAFVAQIPFVYASQLVNIFFFLLFPVSFYILIKFLTKRILTAVLAVLIASLPFAFFAKARIYGAFYGGDNQHIISLGLVPLALFCLISFLRTGGMRNLVTAGLLGSAILLISPFGYTTYLALAVLTAFSETLLGRGRLKLLRLLFLFLLSAALTSFWYNPVFAFWLVFGPLGENLRAGAFNLIPLSLFIVPILGTFGFLLFDRKPYLQPTFLASFWTISFLVVDVAGAGGLTVSTTSRYLPEVGFSLAFLLGLLATYFIDALKQAKITRIPRLNRPAFSNPLITFLLVLLTSVIVVLRNNVFLGTLDSAGLENYVDKGALWLVRDNFGGLSSIVGYFITTITLAGIVIIYIKKYLAKS